MLSSEVYKRRFLKFALYFFTVFFCYVAGAPAIITEAEVFGNDGTFTVFKVIERFTEDFQPPFVVKLPGRLGGGIDGHILCAFFAVLVGVLSVELREHHIPHTTGDHFPCGIRLSPNGKGNFIYGFIIVLVVVFSIKRHCLAEQ